LNLLEARVNHHRIKNVRTLQLDISKDSFQDDGFDFLFTRWLHPYVDNLDVVVKREIDCLKSGGKVGLLEVYNLRGASFAPQSEVFDLVTDKLVQFYAAYGRDVNAGGSLPALLIKCGARVESIENSSPLAGKAEVHWDWYRQFSFSMLPRLVEAGLIDEGVQAEYETEWEVYASIDGAFLSVPSHVAIVATKL
jgi:hypothetical protein